MMASVVSVERVLMLWHQMGSWLEKGESLKMYRLFHSLFQLFHSLKLNLSMEICPAGMFHLSLIWASCQTWFLSRSLPLLPIQLRPPSLLNHQNNFLWGYFFQEWLEQMGCFICYQHEVHVLQSCSLQQQFFQMGCVICEWYAEHVPNLIPYYKLHQTITVKIVIGDTPFEICKMKCWLNSSWLGSLYQTL